MGETKENYERGLGVKRLYTYDFSTGVIVQHDIISEGLLTVTIQGKYVKKRIRKTDIGDTSGMFFSRDGAVAYAVNRLRESIRVLAEKKARYSSYLYSLTGESVTGGN